MPIQFDPANLLADVVGSEHGISRREIGQSRTAAVQALKSFRGKWESGRYGFPDLPFQRPLLREAGQFAAGCAGRFDSICLVGIGGSALGAWALDCALRGPHPVQPCFSRANPRLVILDNVDPELVSAALDSMNPRRTLALVITKSGSTAETIATFLVVRAWLENSVGRRNLARHVAVVTEPGAGSKRGDLLEMAVRDGYRVFPIPENVGGRFSVLSAVGLLPAALIGVDIQRLCAGAREMTRPCWLEDPENNPALRAALLHRLLLERRGKSIQVAFSYSQRLWGLAFWFRQLWAESLGKRAVRDGVETGVGQTPIAALGVTDQHSQVQLYLEGPNDKVVTFWAVRRPKGSCAGVRIPRAFADLGSAGYLGGQTLGALLDAELEATAAALVRHQRPNCCFTLARLDAHHLGAFVQLLEFQVAFLGELMGIDAFNQPGVELGKRLTYALMGRAGFEPYREELDRYQQARRRALGR